MNSSSIRLPSEGAKGVQSDGRATATCFCGEVQLLLPVEGPDMIGTFVCNCTDCHKISASAFASNFIVSESATTHVRGKDKLKEYTQSKTIDTGNTMSNYFCSNCGTLMYRVSSGYPGVLIPRIGTVDDFDIQSNQLKPKVEQFANDRVKWFHGLDEKEADVHFDNFYKGAK